MSVVKGKRGENKLEVLNLAADLVVITLRNCKQEKMFPKRERWLLAMPIAMLAVGSYVCIKMANARFVKTKEDVIFRVKLEKLAHSLLSALLGLMDIAYQVHGFDPGKAEYWTGSILKLDAALVKWTKSDEVRVDI